MRSIFHFVDFGKLFTRKPNAVAIVNGSREYKSVHGIVRFYKVQSGVIVRSEFDGLPKGNSPCNSPIFAFHIHSSGNCHDGGAEPFSSAMGHFNPYGCPHPYHAGDMPPIFSASGRAVSVFLTNRFKIEDILEKSVILHSSPDDFKTQPSGDSGQRIACGIIVPVMR